MDWLVTDGPYRNKNLFWNKRKKVARLKIEEV